MRIFFKILCLLLTLATEGLATQDPISIKNKLAPYDTILVTGGAGFIGSHFIREWIKLYPGRVITLDALTYAGNFKNLKEVQESPRHIFVKGNICDTALLKSLFKRYRPKAVIHFAAESHVDRSIENPSLFLKTNVEGTLALLEASRHYYEEENLENFRFIHISTDEVYGSLGPKDPPFTETTFYHPRTPYAASKAASDHFVNAYFHSYDLPVVIMHCSNNYGPNQYPEKFIPKIIGHALRGEPITVYGDGKNIRDWLHVQDHCRAIRFALARGKLGENYNVGGKSERTSLTMAKLIATLMDQNIPPQKRRAATKGVSLKSYHDLITFTQDRPYEDKRYAMDTRKIERELGWKPLYTFESGICEVTRSYLTEMGY